MDCIRATLVRGLVVGGGAGGALAAAAAVAITCCEREESDVAPESEGARDGACGAGNGPKVNVGVYVDGVLLGTVSGGMDGMAGSSPHCCACVALYGVLPSGGAGAVAVVLSCVPQPGLASVLAAGAEGAAL